MDFTEKYIMPTYRQSEIPKHRKIIRASIELNNLLLKNEPSLTQVFTEYQENGQFTQQSALRIIDLTGRYRPCGPNHHLDPILSKDTVLRCFAFSLMTIHNEQKEGQKYMHLYYVEFLEFLCRCALKLRQVEMTTTKDGTQSSKSIDDLEVDVPVLDTVIDFLKRMYHARKLSKLDGTAPIKYDEAVPLSRGSRR